MKPLEHIAKRKAAGVIVSSESHGWEAPGRISAAADSLRSMAALLLCLLTLTTDPKALLAIGLAWLVWKTGRSAWLGWARLERLHRITEEERWEIEHHRDQEREELVTLYSAKGFEGELLDEVVEVLMADGDRLLQVMLEEELGLCLEVHDHPLKQALGALVGSAAALALITAGSALFGLYGAFGGALLALGAGAYLTSLFEKNRLLPAVVWNLGLGALAYGVAYYAGQLL